MKIRLLGWRAKNLRGYLRDFEIDLSTQPKRWTLLQMPNGTGKTTTMELFRMAFNGRPLTNEAIMSFRADDTVTDGRFDCALEIEEVHYELRLHFDFRRPSLHFETLVPSERSGGLLKGHRLPAAVRHTLAAGVTELFVFDGELAAAIISEGATRADEAIQKLYGLNLLHDLEADIYRQLNQRRRAAQSTTISTSARIAKLRRDFEEVDRVHKHLQLTEQKLRKAITERDKALQSIENEIRSIARGREEFQQEQASIDLEIDEIKRMVEVVGASVLTFFRSPPRVGQVFHDRLSRLGGTLETKRLPRSMSREFFDQLAMSESCVCGRPITSHERETILLHMDDFLAQDEIAVINQMKSRLQAIPSDGNTFTSNVEHLRSTLAELRAVEQRGERLRQRMKDEGVDKVGDLDRRRDNLKRKQILNEEALDRLTRDVDHREADWRYNLTACSRVLGERRKLLATAEGTYDFRRRADKLARVVKLAQSSALSRLRELIRRRTNDYLSRVLINELIEVAAIDGHLRLVGKSAFRKDSVSEGQKLAVAYAFLAALLADARHQFPFIVDSPAVSLDVELRRTVGRLVPQLFDQMLMFVISSEREGFADWFYDHADARFFTVSLDSITGRTGIAEGVEAFRSFHAREGVLD